MVVERTAPVDVAVVEFPGGVAQLAGELSTELASLHEAELIRVLEVVLVERRVDGRVVVEHDPGLDLLGDLADVVGPGRVLRAEEAVRLAGSIAPGSAAAIVVWANAWAEPLLAVARLSGGRVVLDGRVEHLLRRA